MEWDTAVSLIGNKHFSTKASIQAWADLGCGKGLFTRVLASLVPSGSTIYAIDKENNFDRSHTGDKSGAEIIFKQQDIERSKLDLPLLDGILMANVLHYISGKEQFIEKLKLLLKPEAMFLIVEYDMDKPANPWVPYPISFNSLKDLFLKTGFSNIEMLNSAPSIYQRSNLYSALIQS